jgi:hypothetical protein
MAVSKSHKGEFAAERICRWRWGCRLEDLPDEKSRRAVLNFGVGLAIDLMELDSRDDVPVGRDVEQYRVEQSYWARWLTRRWLNSRWRRRRAV